MCAFTRRALVFEGGFRATILISRFHLFFLLRRDKKSTRVTTFHPMMRSWRVFDFVFESKRGKRERNAACASAISRERTRFPCVETAFARVFFSEAPALCSRAPNKKREY